MFLRLPAPHEGLTGPTIASVVQRALIRARISSAHKGTHLLRHSLATRMLRGGASLTQIGQILRHQQADTTEIYARVIKKPCVPCSTLARRCSMKTLAQHLKDYLTLRRSLGFKLRETDCLLRQFVRFARDHKAPHLTTQLAVRWATQPADSASRYVGGAIPDHQALCPVSVQFGSPYRGPAGRFVGVSEVPKASLLLYGPASCSFGADRQEVAFRQRTEGADSLNSAGTCGDDRHAHRRGDRSGAPACGPVPGVAHHSSGQKRPRAPDTCPCIDPHDAPTIRTPPQSSLSSSSKFQLLCFRDGGAIERQQGACLVCPRVQANWAPRSHGSPWAAHTRPASSLCH